MMISKSLLAMAALTAASVWTIASASVLSDNPAEMTSLFDNNDEAEESAQRRLGRRYRGLYTVNVDLNVTNLSFQQPFGQFFVMVHNRKVDPIFTLGMPSSAGLQDLAENGNPGTLVKMYENDRNVFFVGAMDSIVAGGKATFTVPITFRYQYVTIASMCLNTNDCFVALNSQRVLIGAFNSPGYDSGTEQNNESCSSVPGPACPADSGNVASGNGEGFVHIHRGFFGISNDPADIRLSEPGYDWRNPMMRVEIDRSMGKVMADMKKNRNKKNKKH